MGLVSKIMGSAFMKPAIEVIDKLVEDKDERNRLKAGIERAIIDNQVELEKIALENSKLKAKSRMAVLERLPIPSIIYTFLFIIINNSILAPWVFFIADKQIPILPIDDNLYGLIQWIVTGVLGKKIADKSPLVTGVTNKIKNILKK